MFSYIFKRIIQLLFIMLGISFLTFSLTSFLPSDPVTMQYISMGMQVDKEVVEQKKQELGLNDPFIVQYSRWLGKVMQGDFGESIHYNVSVKEKLLSHIPNTLKLTAFSILLTVIFALFWGVLAAINQNNVIDYCIRFISFIGVSMPSFWLGMLLIYYFAIKHKILPAMGSNDALNIILPGFTLAIWYISIYMRRIRTSIIEEKNKDYVIGLLAKGISSRQILFKHILPNSLLPIITAFGMSIGQMLGGTVVIENVFEWQGVGRVAMEAISNRDYALIQGYVLWMALIFVLMNLLVDISYKLLNPKLRLGE